MIRHIGKYRGKTIVFQPKEAVMAHVDGQEIKQVVLNLVVNALDSMETGGTLRIDARYSHGMAEMVFTDNGCGMSAGGARKHLRALLHQAAGGQRDRAGALDHAPDRQPASRRDHGLEPRRGPRRDVQGAAADPSLRDRRGRAIQEDKDKDKDGSRAWAKPEVAVAASGVHAV